MNQKSLPVYEPAIEQVKAKFDTWRRTRKTRKPIPPELLDAAAGLTKKYSISMISKTLGLDYIKLKRHVQNLPLPIKTPASDFIELDSDLLFVSSESLIEMEDCNGSKMKVHLKGKNTPDLIRLSKTFWDKGA